MKTGYITYTTKSPYNLPIPREAVDLVITRLPQPMGLDMPGVDSAPTINLSNPGKFSKDILKVLKEMYRVLKPGGVLVIDTNNMHDSEATLPLELSKDSNFKYLGKVYEQLSQETFNLEFFDFGSVRSWHILSKGVPYFNRFVSKDYFSQLIQVTNSDEQQSVAEWIAEANERSAFDISPAVAARFIEIFAKPNAIVLDPFGGSGAVAIAAASLGRSAVSSDSNSDIIELAKLRTKLAMGEKYFNENVKVVPFE